MKFFIQQVDAKLNLTIVVIIGMLCVLIAFTKVVNFFDKNPTLYEKSLDTIVIVERNQEK
jgi:hypothetical protein